MVNKINPSPQMHGENLESEQVLRELKNFSRETESIKNEEWTLDYFHFSAWDQKDTVSSVYVEYILGVCPEGDQSPPPPPHPQPHYSVLSYTNSFLEEASQIDLHFKLPVISSPACSRFKLSINKPRFTNPSFQISCRRDESHTWGSGTLMSH